MVRATRWINCRTEVSRCGVPCSPKKYFETTTLVASCDQPLGTSTSSCLKMILPASSVISAVRLSHSSSSYGLRLASLNTRSTRMPDPFLPLAKPPRLGAVTFGAAVRRVEREAGAVKFSLASIMGCLGLRLVQGQITSLQGVFSCSTAPVSSVELGNRPSVTTLCWGSKFFLPQIVVFSPETLQASNFLAAQVIEAQNLR